MKLGSRQGKLTLLVNDSPLCVEEFDLSDRNFKPCPCGYQVRQTRNSDTQSGGVLTFCSLINSRFVNSASTTLDPTSMDCVLLADALTMTARLSTKSSLLMSMQLDPALMVSIRPS